MNYKPLPNNLTIKPSHIEGLGIFATETIREGTDLGIVGYLRSLKIMDDMGVDFVNRAEIQVRFKCEKTTES